jgi:hypothetical protein
MPTLKRPHILMLLAISACQFAFGASSEMRTWTDQQGRTLEASLISYDERSATGSFRRSDGMIVKIPRNLLAQADQAQLDTLSSASSTSTADTQQEAIEKQSENYIFSRLSKTGTRGYINTHEGWEYQAKALKVKVRYRGDLPTSQTQYLKAYFYDRNSELIQRYKQAARIQDEDGNYSDPPESFKKNESYELYFPVSNFLEGRDWQRAIVVFGNEQEAAAKIYPSGDLSEYAFSERKLIFGSNLSTLSSNESPTAAEPTKFAINSARKSTFRNTAWVDGDWREGTKGILVRVTIEDALPRGNYYLRVHYFDTDNKLVRTQKQPTQIEINDAANTYTQLPKFAKLGRSHDAYFPFDKEVEATDWRKAVIVFGNKQSVDLAIIGGDSQDLKDLNFPEKTLHKE